VLNRKKKLRKNQYLSVGLILLLLLVAVPVGAQTANGGDVSYSGDDLYDPAAGGLPAISLNPVPQRSIRSSGMTLSGDDPYDPAAFGLDPLFDPLPLDWAAERHTTSFSGDDPYDPAAGGKPQQSVAGSGWHSSSELPCAPTASDLKARRSWSVDGGLSGDDAYDPAAGGTPELSLLAMGLDLIACGPTVSLELLNG
jgi:hypothetical protein